MVGIVRLDDDFAAQAVASGPSGRLRDEHEAALGRAEIRHIEA